MLFMVIEHIRDSKAVYNRLREKGRTLPEGLRYLGSWIGADLNRCFQLMNCADVSLIQKWVIQWQGLVDFEIVPVAESEQTAKAIEPFL